MEKITLELTRNDVNLVLAALGKLPLETTMAVYTAIQSQAIAQLNAMAPTGPEEIAEAAE